MKDDFEISNAIIESARITIEDHGFLDCWLTLDYGGAGQGFGGFALYLPKSFDKHKLQSVAGHHIYRIMEVAGVENWNDLEGKTIRVEHNFTTVKSIGHIVKDDWFCPADDYAKEAK